MCSPNFTTIDPDVFNISEIQGTSEDWVQIEFLDSPENISVDDIKLKMNFTTRENAQTHGVEFKCPDLASQDEAPALIFNNFSFRIPARDQYSLIFNNATFINCSFVEHGGHYKLAANFMVIDLATLLSTNATKFQGVSCDMTMFDFPAFDLEESRQFSWHLTSQFAPQCLLVVGNATETLFQRTTIVVNISGIVLNIAYGQLQVPIITYDGEGNHVFRPASDLDETWATPEVLVEVRNANITFEPGWPASDAGFVQARAQDILDVHMLGANMPVSVISKVGTAKSTVHLYTESVFIAGQILLNNSNVKITSSVTSSMTIGMCELWGDCEIHVETEENALVMFQKSQFSHGRHRIDGNVTVCLGQAYFGRLAQEVSIDTIRVLRGDKYTMEFAFPSESSVDIQNGLLSVGSIDFEGDDVLMNFLLLPGFKDSPNYNQMNKLLDYGFVFLKGNIPSFDKIDFTFPPDGPTWFNAQSDLFHLEQNGRELIAKISELPPEYPEFYCIDNTIASPYCAGYSQLYDYQVPYLCNKLRSASNELWLKVHVNSTEYSVTLPCYENKSVRIFSDPGYLGYVKYKDAILKNRMFSNLQIEFAQNNLTTKNVTLLNCQILNTTYMLNGENIFVDVNTIAKSSLVFSDVTLRYVEPSVGTITLSEDSIELVLFGLPNARFTNTNVQGRLQMVLNCTCLNFCLTGNTTSHITTPGFDLNLVGPCAIDYGRMNISYENSLVIDHGDNNISISKSPLFGGHLKGAGNVTFTDDVNITEKEVYNTKRVFCLMNSSSRIVWKDLELAENADVHVYSPSDEVEIVAHNITVTGKAKTGGLQILNGFQVNKGVSVECGYINSASGSIRLARESSASFTTVNVPNIVVGAGGFLSCINLTASEKISLGNNCLLSSTDNLTFAKSITMSDNATISGVNGNFRGKLGITYDMFSYPMIDLQKISVWPHTVNFVYRDPGSLDYTQFLGKRHGIVSALNMCEPSVYNFKSSNWYFQGENPVVSVECAEKLSIYLARLPQPYATRHVSVTLPDILCMIILGGAALALIIGVTVFFALRWQRELAQLEERYDPFNTSLL